MITVPEKVKEALRDGRRPKNYRVNVYGTQYTYSWNQLFVFKAGAAMSYRFYPPIVEGVLSWKFRLYSAEANTGFELHYYGNGGSSHVVEVEADPTKQTTEYEFTIYRTDAKLDLTDAYVFFTIYMDFPYPTTNLSLELEEATGQSVLDFTMDNNTLVSESVKFDERMCSGDELKFGLCEGTSLEFQYFNHPDITGRNVEVLLDVQYKDENEVLGWHTIPMGFYTVDKCARQASTGIRKATAYNKLMSKYLDNKANELVMSAFYNPQSVVTISDIKRLALSDYEIEEAVTTQVVSSGIGYLTPFDDGVSNTKFTVFAGDMGPISPCDFGKETPSSIGTAIKFCLASDDVSPYTLDPTKYYRIDCPYNLDEYELSFYEYLKSMINTSSLSVDGTSFLTAMIPNMVLPATPAFKTWKFFFGIELTKQGGAKEYYSIVCKNNGVSVNGTMNDLRLKTFTGYTEMRVFTPRYFGYYTGNDPAAITLETINFAGNGEHGSGTITYHYWVQNAQYPQIYDEITATYQAFKMPNGEPFPHNFVNSELYMSVVEVDGLSPAELLSVQVDTLPDYTLRELVSATYETECEFGRLNRETNLFSGVELATSPAEATTPADYSKLWFEEGKEQRFRYLYITYKGLDSNNQEAEFTLRKVVNIDGNTDYFVNDNWLFKNLIWTENTVKAYAEVMAQKMQNLRWFPFELWGPGLPYIETGDEIEIVDAAQESHTSYILERQFGGIQNIQDTYINGTLDIY